MEQEREREEGGQRGAQEKGLYIVKYKQNESQRKNNIKQILMVIILKKKKKMRPVFAG